MSLQNRWTIPDSWLHHAQNFLRDPNKIQALVLWCAAVGVGLAAVTYAQLFKFVELGFIHLLQMNIYLPFVLSPALFTAAWCLVRFFAPAAAGSGIPQIMAANDMTADSAKKESVGILLSLRTAGIKVLSSLLCVAGGGAIGREGPTLQISASIFHFFGRFLKRYYPELQMQTFIVAGAAAGLASAFNTPLGGIVYAIEELGSAHFHKLRTALLSAVIISGMMAQWMLGPYLYLGLPTIAPAGIAFAPWAILTGSVTGLCGALFGWSLYFLVQKRWALQSVQMQLMLTIFCGIAMAGLIWFDPRAAGTGLDVINGYLFENNRAGPLMIVLRYAGTTLSYLSGAAGGIFSPSLAIGATIGEALGGLFKMGHPNLMVLLGMIGFLTGVTRTPFTSFILVVEMTDRHAAILPMMMAAFAAQVCATWVAPRSFYECVKDKYLI